jgi:hypothetical protein
MVPALARVPVAHEARRRYEPLRIAERRLERQRHVARHESTGFSGSGTRRVSDG